MTGAERRGPGTIVVGVDGSRSSRAALRWAVRQADLTGDHVHAVIGWTIPVTNAPVPVPQLWADWPGIARSALEETLRVTLGDRAREVKAEVVQGGPAAVLLEAARDADAELLVVGSRGHGGVTGLLLGSVAQHVTTHARCPVVVVHDREES